VDRPSVDVQLSAADGRTFNLQYELDGGVPLYDRALETPLSDSAAISPDVRRPSNGALPAGLEHAPTYVDAAAGRVMAPKLRSSERSA